MGESRSIPTPPPIIVTSLRSSFVIVFHLQIDGCRKTSVQECDPPLSVKAASVSWFIIHCCRKFFSKGGGQNFQLRGGEKTKQNTLRNDKKWFEE